MKDGTEFSHDILAFYWFLTINEKENAYVS